MTDAGGTEDLAGGGILQGVRVVELGAWVAGPSAAGVLADWGADVVKIEPPTGDPFRQIFATLGFPGDAPNPPFAMDNRGKRSLVLDLRQPEARAAAERVVALADVFVTNFRPDALERLGLDHDTLCARHPRLVYASVSGYGLEGPDRDRPAYDVGAFFARTGIASLLLPGGEPPAGFRGGLGDHVTGLAAVAGILGALFDRERTGRGQVVETSLLRSGMYALSWDLGMQLTFGSVSAPSSRQESVTPLMNSYRAADGRWFFLIGLEGDRHFPSIAEAIGRNDLVTDERFAGQVDRVANRVALIKELDTTFATAGLAAWAERFDRHGVWWSPVNTLEEVVGDPQAEAAGAFVDVGGRDRVRAVAPPTAYSRHPLHTTGPVPGLGEHTDQVLAEAGLTAKDIEQLRDVGALGRRPDRTRS